MQTNATESDRVTFKDVAVTMLAPDQGAEALDSLPARPSKAVCVRAYFYLLDRKAKEHAAELKRWINKRYPQSRQPRIGEFKDYRVQHSNGYDFLRTPPVTLGLKKGDWARVYFGRDKIVIERRPDDA